MKEIIYIHAATSHVASHFFNAQQSYFTYDDEDDAAPVDHDISFREGKALDGSLTYCPRVLLFDSKANFGSLANISALATEETENSRAETWSGGIDEHRQDAIPQSTYHQQLDAGMDPAPEDVAEDLTPSVRYWSDYSRVFFHPRGLHRVPDLAEWQREIGWAQGAERFALYDAEHSVMEDSFRLFAEECDLLQGIQMALDAPSFGSFILPFLSQLRDEFPKLPILSFCALFPIDPAMINLDDDLACRGAINDALTLHELASLSTVTAPLQDPTTWGRGQWSSHLTADFTNIYHSSAVLAAYLESATLPLRLRQPVSSSTDLADMCAHLNWRGNTPFASLSGAFSVPQSLPALDVCTYDFSHPPSINEKYKGSTVLPFAHRDVFRGLYPHEQETVEQLVENIDVIRPRLQSRLHSISYIDTPYPIPSSHPQFFKNLDSTGRGTLVSASVRVNSLPTYASLRTTPRTGTLAEEYARLIDSALTRRLRALNELGAEREAVEESREDWWRWAGAYDA